MLLTLALLLSPQLLASPPTTIAANRSWEVLRPASGSIDHRALLRQAGQKLDRWVVVIDHVTLGGRRLKKLARRAPDEPILRVVREALRRPVDLDDLLLFLDDVLVAGAQGLRGKQVWLPASRARRHGIFVHPDDVFEPITPRRYGEQRERIAIDRPARPDREPPARDGDLLGPAWRGRYPNPSGRRAKLRALQKHNPSGNFHTRVATLMAQLKEQGATVLLYSTLRDRRRGYLMWGAYTLSRQVDEAGLLARIEHLEQCRRDWGLEVPIRWRHPDGWQATREAARRMADAYMVAYATEQGARSSNHYDAIAVDLNVFGLPRTLRLKAPDGAERDFDLSAAEETRDLSLTPMLIDWIEQHFELAKLERDYPHWNDAASLPARPSVEGAGEGPASQPTP